MDCCRGGSPSEPRAQSGVRIISVSDGIARSLTVPLLQTGIDVLPAFDPRGRRLAFLRWGPVGRGTLRSESKCGLLASRGTSPDHLRQANHPRSGLDSRWRKTDLFDGWNLGTAQPQGGSGCFQRAEHAFSNNVVVRRRSIFVVDVSQWKSGVFQDESGHKHLEAKPRDRLGATNPDYRVHIGRSHAGFLSGWKAHRFCFDAVR